MVEMLAKEKSIEILGWPLHNAFSDCDNLKTTQMKCHPRSCNRNTEHSEQHTTEHCRTINHNTYPKAKARSFELRHNKIMGLQIKGPPAYVI